MVRRRLLKVAGIAAVIVTALVVALVLRRRQVQAGLDRHSLAFQGRQRTYYLHLPPGHRKDRAVPLIIALHGGGGNGGNFNMLTNYQLSREADARGWVLVFPEGVARGWNDGRSPVDALGRERLGVDDVGFISALIDRMHQAHGIDLSRVYVTGISNGGHMSYALAAQLSERIAAIAPVTANLPEALFVEEPKRPVSVVVINGTKDPLVPYGGGQVRLFFRARGVVLPTDDTIKWWAEKNRCKTVRPSQALPDHDPGDGTRVHLEGHEGCAEGSRVWLYRVEGGGHTWPRGKQYLPKKAVGRVSQDLDATRAIFDFFAAHQR